MKNFRWILNLFMLIAFLALSLTGILKFPELQRYFGSIFLYFSVTMVSLIHDWSGIALVVLIIIHLMSNSKRLAATDKNSSQNFKKTINIALIVVLLAFSAYIITSIINKNQPVKLGSVEVRDYNGQKLDSINAILDNAIKGTQYIDKNSYSLKVTGLVDKEGNYSYNDILQLPKYQKVVTMNCVEGWNAKILWEGPLVKDLIKNLSVKSGANTVIFYAADGYSTSFPTDYIMNNDIILADKMNGVVLSPEKGFPFELVAEQKWGYKWIKWITKIELSDNASYEGYWEQRGYNNNGDINGSKFQ